MSKFTSKGEPNRRQQAPSRRAVSSMRLSVTAKHVAAITEQTLATRRLITAFSNPVRCQMLFFIAAHPGLSLRDLASLLQCHPSTTTLYVQALARMGWVTIIPKGRMKFVHPASSIHGEAIEMIGLLARRYAPELQSQVAAGDLEP